MTNKIKTPKKEWGKLFALFVTVGLFFYVSHAFAQDSSQGIGDIATNIASAFADLGKLMIAISYLAGIGFTIASVFKFKQHKDNPTQIPMGTPIALLGVGIILIFLPAIVGPVGKTIFGDQGKTGAGGFTGKGAEQLPGGSD